MSHLHPSPQSSFLLAPRFILPRSPRRQRPSLCPEEYGGVEYRPPPLSPVFPPPSLLAPLLLPRRTSSSPALRAGQDDWEGEQVVDEHAQSTPQMQQVQRGASGVIDGMDRTGSVGSVSCAHVSHAIVRRVCSFLKSPHGRAGVFHFSTPQAVLQCTCARFPRQCWHTSPHLQIPFLHTCTRARARLPRLHIHVAHILCVDDIRATADPVRKFRYRSQVVVFCAYSLSFVH
ncbi:hypothetical protein B0H11DRAFT_523477 [Mycena galericulata]|nr:hypothetical protein B0H11DRAFT_523477 [Mycena galericulata]